MSQLKLKPGKRYRDSLGEVWTVDGRGVLDAARPWHVYVVTDEGFLAAHTRVTNDGVFSSAPPLRLIEEVIDEVEGARSPD